MTANGVSKKLCIAAIGISALIRLAEDALPEHRIYYAGGVVLICVIFKIVQGWIDSRKG